jgi:hypothetical protein
VEPSSLNAAAIFGLAGQLYTDVPLILREFGFSSWDLTEEAKLSSAKGPHREDAKCFILSCGLECLPSSEVEDTMWHHCHSYKLCRRPAHNASNIVRGRIGCSGSIVCLTIPNYL